METVLQSVDSSVLFDRIFIHLGIQLMCHVVDMSYIRKELLLFVIILCTCILLVHIGHASKASCRKGKTHPCSCGVYSSSIATDCTSALNAKSAW